jgi:hypothetical protein
VCLCLRQDVDIADIKVQVLFVAFDMLYLNGEVSAAAYGVWCAERAGLGGGGQVWGVMCVCACCPGPMPFSLPNPFVHPCVRRLQSLLEKPLRERRKCLASAFVEVPGRFQFAVASEVRYLRARLPPPYCGGGGCGVGMLCVWKCGGGVRGG